jgi:ADP-ribose pyrophosphatase YjhB (NUDIX family)
MTYTGPYPIINVPPVSAGDDAAEAKWFPVDEALDMNLAFDHNEILYTARTAR